MTNDEVVQHLILWGRWCRTGELAPWLWETDEATPFKLDRFEIDRAWRIQRAVMQLEPLEFRLILQVHYVTYKNMSKPSLHEEVNHRLWKAGCRERQINGHQYGYMKQRSEERRVGKECRL